jgi:hypothetical protein
MILAPLRTSHRNSAGESCPPAGVSDGDLPIALTWVRVSLHATWHLSFAQRLHICHGLGGWRKVLDGAGT